MKKRQSAQDIFHETNFLFKEKTTDFDKAIPGIAEIFVDVKETGDGVNYPPHSIRYTKGFLNREYLPCSNEQCYGGGLAIADIIREMVYDRKTILEGSARCIGKEGSPKGRRIYGSCYNEFEYKIQIKYKQQNQATSAEKKDEEKK